MANQKEYKIIIGGIKESIDGIGTLQDSLDRLGKKVEESGGHFQTASKGMDELAKTEEKIKNYNEEYATALAANKAVLADHNKEVKAKIDLEKAEITVQEGLTDTYAHKQQLLTALGKVIKNTTGDTSELRSQYAQLNQELKDFDATMGNHQRNVGDYRGALKEAQAELKSLKGQLLDVAKGSEEWEKLTKKAGDLEDKIHDINDAIKREASDTKVLDNVINVAQSATAAFTLWKGAMSMFGVETEGAVEAIQKEIDIELNNQPVVLRHQLAPNIYEPQFIIGSFMGCHSITVFSHKIDVPATNGNTAAALKEAGLEKK